MKWNTSGMQKQFQQKIIDKMQNILNSCASKVSDASYY